MKLLTLCVAAYNVESSIGTMIQSVVESGDIDKIELIIINDGSTDSTGHVVSSFLEKYPESIIYIEKENGGSGSARNIGIAAASGVYFKILDGDDKMDSPGLHKLIQCLEAEPADLILTKCVTLKGNTEVRTNQWKGISIGYVVSMDDIPFNMDFQMHYMSVKTSILQNNHIRLTEGISYVDTEYVAYTLPYIKTVLVEDYVVYMYSVGMATQSMSISNCFKKKHQMERITLNIAKYYLKFFEPGRVSAQKRRLLETILLKRYIYTLELYLKDKNSNYNDYTAFDKEFCAVSNFIKEISDRHPYIRRVRMHQYMFYPLMHTYRVAKFGIYRWMKGE